MQYTPALETSLKIPKFTNTVYVINYYLKETLFVLKRGTRKRTGPHKELLFFAYHDSNSYKPFIIE